MNILVYAKIEKAKERLWLFTDSRGGPSSAYETRSWCEAFRRRFTGAPNENIVQNNLNITLLNVF